MPESLSESLSESLPDESLPESLPDESLAHDLAFRARALAQAHALSEPALEYRQWRVARDAPDHPIPELSTWAATAFLTGYCVRRVEESWPAPSPIARPHMSATAGVDGASSLDHWERAATGFANTFASDRTSTLVDHSAVLGALNDVIGREIEKRAEHVKEQVSPSDWTQFESFILWWVLHGYAIRAVEQ